MDRSSSKGRQTTKDENSTQAESAKNASIKGSVMNSRLW